MRRPAHCVHSLRHFRDRGSSAMSRPKLLVWGGNDDPSVDIFDPVSTTWNTLPSAQQWREEASTAVISGRINVCDGYAGGPFENLACWTSGRLCHRCRRDAANTELPCLALGCTSVSVGTRTPPNASTRGATRGVLFQTCVVNVVGWR